MVEKWSNLSAFLDQSRRIADSVVLNEIMAFVWLIATASAPSLCGFELLVKELLAAGNAG